MWNRGHPTLEQSCYEHAHTHTHTHTHTDLVRCHVFQMLLSCTPWTTTVVDLKTSHTHKQTNKQKSKLERLKIMPNTTTHSWKQAATYQQTCIIHSVHQTCAYHVRSPITGYLVKIITLIGTSSILTGMKTARHSLALTTLYLFK